MVAEINKPVGVSSSRDMGSPVLSQTCMAMGSPVQTCVAIIEVVPVSVPDEIHSGPVQLPGGKSRC